MIESLVLFVLRHAILAVLLLSVGAFGFWGGGVLFMRRRRLIRDLRKRAADAEARAQEMLSRIEVLVGDELEEAGVRPQREPGSKEEAPEGETRKAPNRKDPLYDPLVGSFRWRGDEEYICALCGCTKYRSLVFCVDGDDVYGNKCPWKTKEGHIHVVCNACLAMSKYGKRYPAKVFRSELKKGGESR